MFRPMNWAMFTSQKYFIRGNYTVKVIKYINLKFNEISLLFDILMLFMTTLRYGYIIKPNNIIRGRTIKFAKSPLCACHGSTGQNP